MPIDKLSGNSFATGAVANSLGYTPANKAGDTFTGNVVFSANATITGAATFSNTVTVANTITFADSTAMSTAPPGFKNRIINGDFRVWQRGTSFSGVASGQYTADRWQLSYRTAGVTIAQQNNTTYYAARLTNTDASVQSFDFEQRIEDVTQFNNGVFMLSFYAKSSTSVTGNMNCYVNYGSGGSSQDTASYSSAFSVTTTRTKFTIPITFPNMSAKTIGSSNYVRLLFTPVSLPASAWMEIDSIQLEAGATATPFEWRPLTMELQLCHRYYKQYIGAGAPAYTRIAIGENVSGSRCDPVIVYSTVMRTAPTVSISANSHFGIYNQGNSLNIANIYVDIASDTSMNFICQPATGSFSVGGAGQLFNNTTSGRLALSAEL